MRTFCYSLLFLLLLALPTASFGQANAVDAAVNGYVLDPSKTPIAGAHITLTNVATGIAQDATTDGQGYYRFPLVPVGTYRLDTVANGFETNTLAGIVLRVGQEARLDIPLVVGSMAQTVQVLRQVILRPIDDPKIFSPATFHCGLYYTTATF